MRSKYRSGQYRSRDRRSNQNREERYKEMPLKPVINNGLKSSERLLEIQTYWVEVPVNTGQRYTISGYVRSREDEKRDAAIAIFDLGDHKMDEATCHLYGLRRSKIGIYRYLPMGQEIGVWSFEILIPEEIRSFKIGFRTWKNRYDVVLGTELTIEKDEAYSKIYRDLQKRTQENKRLNMALLRERQATENARNTLSFRLGYLLIHAVKSWKGFLNLPSDLYHLRENWYKGSKRLDCKTISSRAFSKTIEVLPNKELLLQGKIISFAGENKHAALIQVDFLNITLAKESARRLGLLHSDKIGFYAYLPTSEAGERAWKVRFKVPEHCQNIKLTWMTWYNIGTIKVCLDDEITIKSDVTKDQIDKMTKVWTKEDAEVTAKYIEDLPLPNYHQADLYAALAGLESLPKNAKYYQLAYESDPTYERATKMFRRIVDGGLLHVSRIILQDFEQRNHDIRSADMRNINYARGYVTLYDKLPYIPERTVASLESDSKKAIMFLHVSLPYHSNGYATRSHAILSTMLKVSQYDVRAVTRSGYPFDIGIKKLEDEDHIDGVSYLRLEQAHYYDQPIDQYISTAADEIEKRLRDEKPSVVHAASAFYNALPVLIAARRLGIPFVYEVRGLWEITRASTIPGWGSTERFTLESNLEAMVAKAADQVITITNGLKKELVRRGVDEEKITIIPNAINKERFKVLPLDQSLKEQVGLSNDLTIGYVGSMVGYEGLEELVEALGLLKEEGLAFNFLLIGDGNALPGIRAKVKEVGLSDETFILGQVQHHEVEAYYTLIDITPFPRKGLPVCEMVSPLKPFEAMAMGKVVLASDVAALQEIVEDEKTGLLFEKDNIVDMAKQLKRLLTDKGLRERLAKHGKEWVLANRDWSDIGSRFDKVYDKAIEISHESTSAKIASMQTSRALSLLVYGDLNLNYVDGSAVWACSLVEMLSGLENVSVTFLLKVDLVHDTLVESLKLLNDVTIISPLKTSKKSRSLRAEDAIEVLEELQIKNSFDGIILRGFEINRQAAEVHLFRGKLWPYMIDVFQTKESWDDGVIADVTDVVKASYTVFCQTTYMQEFLEGKIPESEGKTSLLPPMVPEQSGKKKETRSQSHTFKIVYAGKFAPLWGTTEMLATFKALRKEGVDIELHVYGDKIHNPPEDPSFRVEVEHALSNMDGLIWHKALPRTAVIAAMRTYDLAWAWRQPKLEQNTDEVSTKFLEYSSVGLPMLVIGNKITTELLTDEYPLFVNEYEQLVPTIKSIMADPISMELASSLVYKASKPFLFSAVREKYISGLITPLRMKERQKSILFAGHDLKFIDKIMQRYADDGYTVLVDKWQGHDDHDEILSKELLSQADIIFCEWCLGNAVWYSQHISSHQNMYIRLHLQELDTAFPADVDYEAVDKMVFISPYVQREAIERFSLHRYRDKIELIPNYIDTDSLALPKRDDARFNLGFVGIVPQRKRFDRALDILETLRKNDDRFQLFVKGKVAKEYSWMLDRHDEMQYYEKLTRRVENSDLLRGAVHFDGFGDDMERWFQKIGFILSTSDFEGSHQSVAEGMASGALSVIMRWKGADEIYPKENCFDDIDRAIDLILDIDHQKEFDRSSKRSKEMVKRFDLTPIYRQWKELTEKSTVR